MTTEQEQFLSKVRYGCFTLDAKQILIAKRIWPPIASYLDVFWNERFRSGESNSCEVFFSFPRRSPGYMTVNYLRSGPATEYLTIRSSVNFVELIATSRASRAIVCQVVSSRISDRLMKRWGYVAHAASLGPGHYIRRLETLSPNP